MLAYIFIEYQKSYCERKSKPQAIQDRYSLLVAQSACDSSAGESKSKTTQRNLQTLYPVESALLRETFRVRMILLHLLTFYVFNLYSTWLAFAQNVKSA
jgi:hypothetical protein